MLFANFLQNLSKQLHLVLQRAVKLLKLCRNCACKIDCPGDTGTTQLYAVLSALAMHMWFSCGLSHCRVSTVDTHDAQQHPLGGHFELAQGFGQNSMLCMHQVPSIIAQYL